MTKILVIGAFAAALAYLLARIYRGMRSREARHVFGPIIRREENPTLYWSVMGFRVVVVILVVTMATWSLLGSGP